VTIWTIVSYVWTKVIPHRCNGPEDLGGHAYNAAASAVYFSVPALYRLDCICEIDRSQLTDFALVGDVVDVGIPRLLFAI
jgi:hypothetical protein